MNTPATPAKSESAPVISPGTLPGDVLPLWNPDIPGEEIQTGRLDIRVRPGTPAAAKVTALEAAGGAELLRQVLEVQKVIDGTYSIVKPEKPLEFVGQLSTTLLTGKLGRTPMGLALEITDWQELEGPYEMEKNRMRLRFQELHVVKEWRSEERRVGKECRSRRSPYH